MNRLEITSFKERVDLVKVVGHYSTLERKGRLIWVCALSMTIIILRCGWIRQKEYTTVLVAEPEEMSSASYRRRRDVASVRRSVFVRISATCLFPHSMRERKNTGLISNRLKRIVPLQSRIKCGNRYLLRRLK